MNSTTYLSDSAEEIQEQSRRAANLRVARVLPSYREAERLGYHSIKSLRQMGLEVEESERQNHFYMVEFQERRLPVYSLQQCVGLSAASLSSRQADGTALQDASKSHAVIGPFAQTDRETDPSSTNTQLLRPATILSFDVQNGLKAGTGQDLPPKSQLDRSRGSGASCTAYFPKDFQTQDWAAIKGDEEAAAVVFHQLYMFRHVHGLVRRLCLARLGIRQGTHRTQPI